MPDILRLLSAPSTKMNVLYTWNESLVCARSCSFFVSGTNAEENTVDKPNTQNGNEYTWEL